MSIPGFLYKPDLEADYCVSVASQLAADPFVESDSSAIPESLSYFITLFSEAFANGFYDELQRVYDENPFPEYFSLSLRPPSALKPEFIDALSYCLSPLGVKTLSFLGLTLAWWFFVRDYSANIQFLIDLDILPLLSDHVSSSTILCLAIAADISVRSRGLCDLVLLHFPLDLCSRLVDDGNPKEVACLLIAYASVSGLGDSLLFTILRLNARIFESTLTENYQILDPMTLPVSLLLFHALRRLSAYSAMMSELRIDEQLDLVLRRKLLRSFTVQAQDYIPALILQVFADLLLCDDTYRLRFSLTAICSFFVRLSEDTGGSKTRRVR
jgi:hypothetical protein